MLTITEKGKKSVQSKEYAAKWVPVVLRDGSLSVEELTVEIAWTLAGCPEHGACSGDEITAFMVAHVDEIGAACAQVLRNIDQLIATFDAPEHNYTKLLEAYVELNPIEGVNSGRVIHEDCCSIHAGKLCDCRCDIQLNDKYIARNGELCVKGMVN